MTPEICLGHRSLFLPLQALQERKFLEEQVVCCFFHKGHDRIIPQPATLY